MNLDEISFPDLQIPIVKESFPIDSLPDFREQLAQLEKEVNENEATEKSNVESARTRLKRICAANPEIAKEHKLTFNKIEKMKDDKVVSTLELITLSFSKGVNDQFSALFLELSGAGISYFTRIIGVKETFKLDDDLKNLVKMKLSVYTSYFNDWVMLSGLMLNDTLKALAINGRMPIEGINKKTPIISMKPTKQNIEEKKIISEISNIKKNE